MNIMYAQRACKGYNVFHKYLLYLHYITWAYNNKSNLNEHNNTR